MTIFDILDNIVKTKSNDLYINHIKSDDFEKTYNLYMIIKWLSMNTNKSILSKLTEYQSIMENITDKELHYKLLLKIIPQNRNIFLKYVK